jgi:thiamine biosynthesis lipoprotein
MLEKKGIKNYLVDIGGEVVARGVNNKGTLWSIGINKPSETSKLTDLVAIIPLDNKGMATSGNYRNFYEVNGVKYSHTINPKTGFPERNTLLSATIVAQSCMYADAMATACMVMGVEASIKWIQEMEEVEAYLIYGKEDGSMGEWHSAGLKDIFEKE